jgi:hypothetical protein
MDNIIEPTMDYDFSKLYLGPPSTLSGGSYFTRIFQASNKPIYIQTPKCLSKQGFVKSGKKIYSDLMFDNNDTIFINWIENLESKCQELIFTKGSSWFETKLEKDDIESAFTSPFKIFKSGKYYLMRVNVKQNIRIEDENDQLIQIDSINDKTNLISIIEIVGIKFTSRNFQIEFEMKQSIVVSPDPFLDTCFIKKPKKQTHTNDDNDINNGIINNSIINNSINNKFDDDISNVSNNEIEVSKNKENLKFEQQLDINNLDEFIKETAKEINEKESESKELNITSNDIDDNNKDETPNIELDVEDLDIKPNSSNNYTMEEVDLSNVQNLETMSLKKPNQVYYELYQKAREKAKQLKKEATVAFLEMKNIKKTYMLEDSNDSDSEFEDFETEEFDYE